MNKSIKSFVSGLGHLLLWTRPGQHISLLRTLIAVCAYGAAMEAWILLPGGDRDNQKFFLEIIVVIFTVISVFEISDGVVLSKLDAETLKNGGAAANALVPKLLIDASQKCKVGLVFAVYGWLADMAIKHLL